MNYLLDQVEKILADGAVKKPTIKEIRLIQSFIAEHYGITTKDLLGPKRGAAYVYPRHLAMYLCRKLTQATYPLIAQEFIRDHSTVIFACRKIAKELNNGGKNEKGKAEEDLPGLQR